MFGCWVVTEFTVVYSTCAIAGLGQKNICLLDAELMAWLYRHISALSVLSPEV